MAGCSALRAFADLAMGLIDLIGHIAPHTVKVSTNNCPNPRLSYGRNCFPDAETMRMSGWVPARNEDSSHVHEIYKIARECFEISGMFFSCGDRRRAGDLRVSRLYFAWTARRCIFRACIFGAVWSKRRVSRLTVRMRFGPGLTATPP